MNPQIGAALIGAGSNLVGGLLGGSKQKRPKVSDYGNYNIGKGRFNAIRGQGISAVNKVIYDDQMGAVMDAAKKYGIHPLHMLGTAPTHTGGAHISGGSSSSNLGDAIAQGGSEIARAVLAGQSNMERLQERLLLAQIEGQEIDNVSRASMVARTFGQAGNPPASPYDEMSEKLSRKPGYGRAAPLFNVAIDERGNPIRVWNEGDLGEGGEVVQALMGLGHTIPDVLRSVLGIKDRALNKRGSGKGFLGRY